MLYALSDTHLSFASDKPMDVFGKSWENHAKKIKINWENTVKDTDTVVVAGDVSWGMSLEEAKEDLLFINNLPGKKIFLKGNHDYWWCTAAKMSAFFKENNIDTIDIKLQEQKAKQETFKKKFGKKVIVQTPPEETPTTTIQFPLPLKPTK